MKDEVQQRLVDLDMAIIADETQLAESVHEKADRSNRTLFAVTDNQV